MLLAAALVFIASEKASASAMLRGPSRAECVDFLPKEDCLEQKNYRDDDVLNGYCYIYAEECEKTCGCDYDQAAARAEEGLDDAYYASDEFECVNENEFEDAPYKFNCTLYEGARWCQVNDNGDTVEGPGWCDWFDPSPDACHIPRGARWVRHASFANAAGRWAKSCCCNTGLADTYPYEGDGECVDRLDPQGRPWTDTNGYSCRAYHFGSFCTLDGQEGPGWDRHSWGRIRRYTHFGMNPLEACCTCGGAGFAPTYAPTSSWEEDAAMTLDEGTTIG